MVKVMKYLQVTEVLQHNKTRDFEIRKPGVLKL